jgi:multiple sugar transport system permease protein
VLTNGGPNNSTTSVVYLLYKAGFINNQVGYSSAIAVVFFLIVLVISLVQNRLLEDK